MKNTHVWGVFVAALFGSLLNASSLPGQIPNPDSLAFGKAALLLEVALDVKNPQKKELAPKKDLPQKPDFAPAQNKHRKGFPHNQNSK